MALIKNTKSICFTTVGYICSGKTSVVNKINIPLGFNVIGEYYIINDLLNSKKHKSYSQAFLHGDINSILIEQLKIVRQLNDNIIVDQSNLTVDERNVIIELLPEHYHIAINVHSTLDLCRKRFYAKERNYRKSKMVNMMQYPHYNRLKLNNFSLNPPAISEGYSGIIHANSRAEITHIEGSVPEILLLNPVV